MSFDDPVRRNGCRRDGKSPDDIAVWLRDRGTLMVNSGDQFVASDGERLLEGADEIEQLRAQVDDLRSWVDSSKWAEPIATDSETERLRARAELTDRFLTDVLGVARSQAHDQVYATNLSRNSSVALPDEFNALWDSEA